MKKNKITFLLLILCLTTVNLYSQTDTIPHIKDSVYINHSEIKLHLEKYKEQYRGGSILTIVGLTYSSIGMILYTRKNHNQDLLVYPLTGIPVAIIGSLIKISAHKKHIKQIKKSYKL